MLVDTHAHISKTDDVEDIIRRTKEAGVEKIILAGTNLEDSKYNVELASKYPELYASVGIYPHEEIGKNVEKISEELEKIIQNGNETGGITPGLSRGNFSGQSRIVKAIGECGLDYKENRRSPQEQIKLFRAQIFLAEKYHLPLIIHSRDSYGDVLQELKNHPNISGVFHCFVGDEIIAKEILDINFYLSFTGIITYQNAENLREVVKIISLDKILLETDSPFLVPEPLRSSGVKINSLENVTIVAKKIGELKDLSLEEVAKATRENAMRLFKI